MHQFNHSTFTFQSNNQKKNQFWYHKKGRIKQKKNGGKERHNVPSTGSSTGDLRLELNRQAQETIEPVEGDVSHVADVGRPADLHGTELPRIALASNQRFSENGDEQSQQRQLIPLGLPLSRNRYRIITGTTLGVVVVVDGVAIGEKNGAGRAG